METSFLHILNILCAIFCIGLGGLPPRRSVYLLVDQSSSVDAQQFELGKTLMRTLLYHYSVSLSTTKVGIVGCSSDNSSLVLDPMHSFNRDHVLSKMQAIRHEAGDASCNIQKGLYQILVKIKRNQDRDGKAVIIIIGNSQIPAYGEVKTSLDWLRKQKIRIYHVSNRLIKVNIVFQSIITHIRVTFNKDIPVAVKRLPHTKEFYGQCLSPGITLDECNRVCECQNNLLRNCYRIRREVRQLGPDEVDRYHQTYKLVQTSHRTKDRYIAFIKLHYKYFFRGVHTRAMFFPWHRWYLYEMENLLQEYDCRVTVPYWDWSHKAKSAWNDTFLFNSDESFLGGNGDKRDDFCVKTGPYSEKNFRMPAYEDGAFIANMCFSSIRAQKSDLAYRRKKKQFRSKRHRRCLRRLFTGHPPNEKEVNQVIRMKANEFNDMELRVRVGFHNAMHCVVGGTMCTYYAGDSPEFFLHHAFIDKIWKVWQDKDEVFKQVYFKGSTKKLLSTNYTCGDFIDSEAMPHGVRVNYTIFKSNPIETAWKRIKPILVGNKEDAHPPTYQRKADDEESYPDSYNVDLHKRNSMILFQVPREEQQRHDEIVSILRVQ